ncbi:MAG: hypothetical protein PHN82_07610 [bacterium]|nr:hypothetical protein [bacterium]
MAPWRRPLVRVALYIGAVIAAAYLLFLSPAALRAHVRGAVLQVLDADVDMGAVSLRPLAGLTIERLAVRPSSGGAPIFEARRIRLRPRWRALARGRFEIAGLSLHDARLTVLQEADGRSPWAQSLRRGGVPAGGRPPVFRLRNGTVTVGHRTFHGLDCEIVSFPSKNTIAIRGGIRDPFWGDYAIAGDIDRDAETIRLSFESRGLRLTGDWVRAFPLVGRDIWERYAPEGLFDLSGSVTHCWGSDRRLDYNLLFTGKDSSCRYLVFPVTDATGRVFVDPRAVVVNQLRGRLFGGRVEGYSIVNLDSPRTHFSRYAFTGVDMGEFLRGFQTSPAPLAGSGSGHAEFSGDSDLGTLTGRAEVRIPDARLWRFPVILSILSWLQYDLTRVQEPLQDCTVVFTFSEDGYTFEEISLVSDVLDIYGEGRADPDGSLDLTFYARPVTRTPIFLADLLIQPAIDSIAGNVAQFGVTGTAANPRLRVIPLRPLGGRIVSFFDALTRQRAGR